MIFSGRFSLTIYVLTFIAVIWEVTSAVPPPSDRPSRSGTHSGRPSGGRHSPRNKTIQGRRLRVDTIGISGEIIIRDGKHNRALMHINPHELIEYAEDGTTEVGDHSIKSFGHANFTISDPIVGPRYNLDATTVEFKTIMGGKGEMTVEMIVFKEGGTIVVDSGEEYDIAEGAVKFNVDIRNWTFCDTGVETCKNKKGKFLDLTMDVGGENSTEGRPPPKKEEKRRGRKGRSKANRDPESYDMDGAVLMVSPMVKIDGKWDNMTGGFPKVKQMGKKTLFTFRFHKFNGTVYYDPIGQIEGIEYPTSDSNTLKSTNYFYVMLMGFAMVGLVFY